MQIQENVSLKPYNTFGIDVRAKYFSPFQSIEALKELLQHSASHLLILGGGSNILFTKNVEGLVAKNELKGIELVKEDETYFYVKVMGGENWHVFVQHCIAHNYAGIENLSLIPGNVGASPMQNIGAYGVEIKDVFYELDAYHIRDCAMQKFSADDCVFGYRESVFKRKYKDQFVILSVTYRLRKQPVFNTSYGAIEQELEKMGIKELSIKAISQAVINIRSSKLPDPAVIGNAGSFFKNPQIPNEQFLDLRKRFSNIVGHPVGKHDTKLAAGWLIEQCGWKGYREGDAGCHAKQALVLVNYGNAKGEDIYDLSTKIVKSVKEKFVVELEREVNIMPPSLPTGQAGPKGA
ncbi:MAG: UDP-N-acetylmuramate dehydrogenase [Panacibacter sp.]